jgi:hypothetical protein
MVPDPQRVTIDGGGADGHGAARVAVGQVIDRYRIDEILGAGGMGIVVRARDLDLDRDVALKVAASASDAARDRRRAELLLREARAMARVRMPNVRRVHDIGSAAGIDYIAMEYIAGVDLARWLATPRSLGKIARVFAAAGRGLAAAHAAGVLHRDFKPSNVLVGDDGDVVVTDFGLSRWLHEPGTAAGGTPRYMPPAGDPEDPRSDQYSFSIALGEALGHAAVGWRETRLRRRLERIARRGAAPRASDRYAAMTEVVVELEAAVRRPRWPLAVVVAAAGIAALGWTADDGDRAPMVRIDKVVAAILDRPIELELDQAQTLAERGYFRSARKHAEAAVALAAGRSVARSAAAHYHRGYIALLEEDTATARTALETAAQLADQQGDDAVRARALLALFQAAVSRGSQLAVAERAERAAAAALARIAPERGERARLRALQGVLAARRGDDAGCERALAEARRMVTPPTLRDLLDWSEIGRSQASRLRAAGDRDGAIALLREVVATADEIAGRDHMTAISARGHLARILEASGRDAEAHAVLLAARAAGQTPTGARLLDEIAGPSPPTRVVHVAVRDRSGAPVAGATVVAATAFHANALHLPGAASLYAERAQATVLATSDARGLATLAVAEGTSLWFAAEHAAIGRSPSMRAVREPIELVLSPWGTVSGTAPPDARISLTPADQPDAPPLVLRASAQGRFGSERVPLGRYLLSFCVDGGLRYRENERCAARDASVGAQPVELALSLARGPGSLVVHPRDELARPIESSIVLLAPAGYAPDDLRTFETGWQRVVARRPGAFIGRVSLHAEAAARLSHVPPGHYSLCAAAIHGDTEDPSFTARLEVRRGSVPLFCSAITVGDAPVERDLVIPAARRVWLGDEPRDAGRARDH